MSTIKFVYSETYDKFVNELNIGNVTNNSIVFINDVSQIWTRGNFYSTKLTASEVEDIVISSPSVEQFVTQLISKSTNGVVFDNTGEGTKFLSDDGTYREINDQVIKLSTSNQLSFYCIEPVTVTVGGEDTLYPANSYVTVFPNDAEFSITTTSNNSILNLTSWPGALGEFYPWLEGVQLFSNILFDMNDLAMYEKWNQGHQGQYHVQFAQYVNCIFWSDNAYVSAIAERTNYTLYFSSQLPLCYSTIPENTFKSFYCAYGVTSDPNWSNQAYKDSFAAATWATQAFSYYGLHSIGIFDMDASYFNITLPKDCRGLMFAAHNILNAGVFDAVNVTNFGSRNGSWRDAFGYCHQLSNLYIKNLKVDINVSWSPISQEALIFIIENAANTKAISLYLSSYTYYRITDDIRALATEKNINLVLLEGNYADDARTKMLQTNGDGGSYLSNDGTYKKIEIPEIPSLDGCAKTQELEALEANVNTSLDALETESTKLSSRVTTVENYTVPDARNKVLWIGTSIPAGDIQHANNGTSQSITTNLGSNNYPKMVADALGFTLFNNARGSSFLCFYPSSEDGTDSWASASDWQEYSSEVWKGYSLSASFAQVDEKFGPNGLNCPRWLIENFKSYSYESLIIPYIDGTIADCDTVVIDHGYNDRGVIINEASWHPGEGETQFATGAGRDWLLKLQDPFETTLEAESYFQGKWWNDESVSSKKHYLSALIFLAKKIWAVNPRIKIIIGNYFASKSNTFNAEFGNDRLAEFVNLANSACASWLRVNCVDVWKHTGLYNRNLPAGNDFQLFCPDGVHPHSDPTGHSNSIIAGVYINAIRGTLYNWVPQPETPVEPENY